MNSLRALPPGAAPRACRSRADLTEADRDLNWTAGQSIIPHRDSFSCWRRNGFNGTETDQIAGHQTLAVSVQFFHEPEDGVERLVEDDFALAAAEFGAGLVANGHRHLRQSLDELRRGAHRQPLAENTESGADITCGNQRAVRRR